ncbi:septum site determining protein [Spiractinospora alimapuensis]|uniref:septum site-determining protein Ssd n=1 Tax=Spiractinospora alimapuensis TaxID=2820884 RepID=UPI001F3A6525|nr:septum site-determining protein Ssd [Spiractinospora alimapuensis]QVQ50359.1 septum site determining protein [Spiractinospora alimapuensis]
MAPASAASSSSRPSRRSPLLVTGDPTLLEEVLRLTAAVGTDPVVASAVAFARRDWDAAAFVIVGADLAEAMAEQAPRRHPNLVVVGHAPQGSPDEGTVELWRCGVRLGAREVLFLPEGEARLTELCTAPGPETARAAHLVAVIGGRGGAGASLLSSALALAGVRRGVRTLLIDADPLGGGLDLLLGHENTPGVRWQDLLQRQGRINAHALFDALPTASGFSLLTWEHQTGPPPPVPTTAMRSVLASAAGAGLLVVDLPRTLDEAARETVLAAHHLLVLVPDDVHSVVAASRLSAVIRTHTPRGRVVVRRDRARGVSPDVISTSVGLPLAGELPDEPGLRATLERGTIPAVRRGSPLRTFCDGFLAGLDAGEAEP